MVFRLDPEDEGIRLKWFRNTRSFKDTISVPGCWQGQGLGTDGKDEVWDFRLQARTFRATYQGTGWYAKEVNVPADWNGRKIWLNFGGIHPSAQVWLNGTMLGEHSGPFLPFGFDVTDIVSLKNHNSLVVRIFEKNRWLGLNYNFQGNWSGLYRSVELTSSGECWIDRCWIHPDVDTEKLTFSIQLGGAMKLNPLIVKVHVVTLGRSSVAEATEKISDDKEVRFDVEVPSPKLWSPVEPNLYRVDVELRCGDEILDSVTERIGFVKLSTKGKLFLINNEPYYMRGTGDHGSFPETGSPDTDRDRWRKKLCMLRKFGYNYVRLMSVHAPEYYDIADEAGLLIQGDMGMLGAWSGHSQWHIYQWPQPLPRYRKLLRDHWNHTVMRDVNHPSANLYCMSNELKESLFPETAWQCYRVTKRIKPSALVIYTDGFYNRKLPGDFINAEASIDNKCPLPVIQHEYRWWSTYPDVRIKGKYKGALRPYAIEIAERAAKRSGIRHLLPAIARNSHRLQYVEAKTKMENCRRDNKRLAGICHFNAMDVSLSPQGVLDEFYDTKFVDAAAWRQTNDDTVVLIDRNFDDRVLVGGEVFQSSIFISDFSHPPFTSQILEWELSDGGKRFASGKLPFRHKPFCTCLIGRIKAKLPRVPKPQAAKLLVKVSDGKRAVRNRWNFWIFPKPVPLPTSFSIYGEPTTRWVKRLKREVNHAALVPKSVLKVFITEMFNKDLIAYASVGGRILLAANEGLVRPFYQKFAPVNGRYFFLPPANYPPYEDGQTGTIVQTHPMLSDFPHEGFCDMQFYRMIADYPPIELEPFGKMKADPVIRAVGQYVTCHNLAYLLELGLGKGGIIISSVNFDPELPESRYLLSKILRYAASTAFQPKEKLSKRAGEHLLSELSR